MRASGDEFSTAASIGLLLGLKDRAIATISVLVEHMGVSVRESTSLNILTRDTHVVTVVDESGKSKCLSSTPVDAFLIFNGFVAILVDLHNVVVEFSVSRQS